MSFQKIGNFSQTLSFRLTLWYAGIFMVSTLLLLLFFYHYIARQILLEVDAQLEEEIVEFQTILHEGGLPQVRLYLVIEVESETESTFFRLISMADGKEVAMETNFQVTDKKLLDNILISLKNTAENIFQTITISGYPNNLRVVTGKIGQGFALQVGTSFVHDEKVLALFKRLAFFVAFPFLIVSAVIGWFLARRALKDVEQVTLTAEKIAGGDYNQRVRLQRNVWEVQKLADTFNTMLDRIQTLIKAMREVTDNIAHDLRSPLARIRGQAERVIIGNSTPENCRDMAASTIEECDNLIDMINTMLDITEAEAGVEQITLETVAMSNLIRAACELLEPVARQKDIRLTSDLPENQIYVRADKHKLQRLVTNMIENSIKYNRPGGTVNITATIKDQWLLLRFEDTGQGIPGHDLDRIFDRFYRCDASRSEPGLGLGLSLVKAIVGAAGGDITVESKINQGTRFTIRLPLK